MDVVSLLLCIIGLFYRTVDIRTDMYVDTTCTCVQVPNGTGVECAPSIDILDRCVDRRRWGRLTVYEGL